MKDQWLETLERKQKGRPKKGQRMHSPTNPSNATYMQIMRSNSNGRSSTSIARQRNFPLYSRS